MITANCDFVPQDYNNNEDIINTSNNNNNDNTDFDVILLDNDDK